MEKNYTYVVHYERRNPISKGQYSILVDRDTPIITEEDKELVKKIVRKKHKFSRYTFIWYKLIKAPYDCERSILYTVHKHKPF